MKLQKRSDCTLSSAVFFVLLFTLFLIQAYGQDRNTGKNFASRSEVIAKNGMVCSSQPLATQIGLDTQIIMNILDFGMNVQEAGDAPRYSHDGSSSPTGDKQKGKGEVHVETGFDAQQLLDLTRMGHRVSFSPEEYGGYQAIWFDALRGIYIGASESRKDGQAAGY